ncbi:YifB family Mg chelatase-like AAA ATPase [Roseomonas elaeocarpi]|uniref:YifB family Mg chelatase-like AAA ATPase n=1 Tax=Roseomonas elaeocarpi TaxID=907779 RepID=A0ABV6JXN4_9PROT
MTIARVSTFAFSGIEAIPVEVQVQVAPGLPGFTVVGMPNKAVAESRERVRAVFSSLGLSLPPRRVLVNLAPADLPKEGTHFDLPIALSLLAAMEVIPPAEVIGYAALGELALDGAIGPTTGILLAALEAGRLGLGLVCPKAQAAEAAWAADAEILAADDLRVLIAHFQGRQILSPPARPVAAPEARADGPCLSEVRGQESAKRALEVAAAGSHNLLFVGPPGAGKSMLAERMAGILPPLTQREALEVSTIRSVAGLPLGNVLSSRPPFRNPHHSASQAALTGGGPRGRPGEITLAHRGVLFLDELPEFPRPALEALRQPLESGEVVVSRVAAHVTYPARVQLVAAMNPCRCGHLGEAGRECGRAPRCGEDYRAKLSGPVLDRLDMVVGVQPIPATELSRAPAGEPSAAVAARVAAARERQRVRWGEDGPRTNAEAPIAALQPSISADAMTLAEQAVERLRLSNRGFVRTLRVARSIADLAGEAAVERAHVAEALAYRQR